MKATLLPLLLISLCSINAFAAEPGAPGGVPPGEKEARAVLDRSPRHGEFVDIAVPDAKTPLKSYVVYPERKDKAPVVIVIHEIFGQSDWVRSVADQLAADGFIAIAPDLLSGHGPNGGGTDSLGDRQAVMRAVSGLQHDEVMRDLDAVRAYGASLPASDQKTAVIGFCWGGGQSFAYAAHQPGLSAAVVYYGVPPAPDRMRNIQARVAGFYGGNDARISATIPKMAEQMKQLGKTYLPHVYDGAGHGFLRAQDNSEANKAAARQAWPLTIQFLQEHTK